ncbi:stimulated by retinoic acid gene 6 protein-like isoform X2 [Mauremys reevesii]|uniref:stimulated by retinoic acid gene 6 protein-like isoform X2 n=1 Tax=Mauremys reevesii TaxID=260615 RepID=UPI00193F8F21|nr:stimulated by retinoic acid gene 6 protein-like isoform X2 [Mauremys reevesii]
MLSAKAWDWQTNATCESSVDMELVLHYSLIPSFAIILVLSFLERRMSRSQIDGKLHLLNGRFGIVIPLDFVGTFSNRWSFGIAFGATANKVMFLFSEGYLPLRVPKWAQAIVLLIGATEVGLSYFPFFACLSTEFQITGSVLGFFYTFTWFVITITNIVQCPHGQVMGDYEKIIFYWPSLFCLVFLLGRFALMFVKGLRVHLKMDVSDQENHFLEVHQAQHVKRLVRKSPERQAQKSWFQRKVYEWDPCFQFPGRMIGTSALALICLYIFIVIEFFIYKEVSKELKILDQKFEELVDSSNGSEVLVSTVLQLKEFINVIQGVWIFTTFAASLTCVSYIFHILACYRKHMKRLWAGKKHFLPLRSHEPASSQSVAAIARYSGWQIAYILWGTCQAFSISMHSTKIRVVALFLCSKKCVFSFPGYLIIHVMQCLFGVMIMYSFVLPIQHGQGLEMAKGLAIGILTVGIATGLMILQIKIAARFFLQPKILPDDKQKPLALNNRKAFHNFNYFLFFYNVLLGLGACLFRLLCSVLLGTWLIARIDRTIMQKGYEAADMGFNTWVGMIFMDHYHTNPTLLSFCHILLAEKKLHKSTKYYLFNNIAEPRVSTRARTRWLLLYTLLNNPKLTELRKPNVQSGASAAPQNPCV